MSLQYGLLDEPDMSPLVDYYTTKDICSALNVHKSTVERWRKDKTLPFPMPSKLNGRNLYKKTAVMAWLNGKGIDEGARRLAFGPDK